jgi:hypothetical protein
VPARLLTRRAAAAGALFLAGCSLDASGVGSASPGASPSASAFDADTVSERPSPDRDADATANADDCGGVATRGPAPLLGDDAVEPLVTTISPGLADAFAFEPRADGQATQVAFYVDASSTATALEIGVYADAARGPGALLGSAKVTPAPASWATGTLSTAIRVHAGERLWLAVLGVYGGGGALAFRTRGGERASQALPLGLAALPSPWGAGAPTTDGPASAYVF